ncbi:hypothetical protein A3752_07205 [Oleiphilus sp. HI0081]|nr:hypothetical protein A3743_08230 [Oleiphilus sp. HI0072]KZZ22123.1 hypothetical protein A3752_07205 [Oleiphilus sp. HI0081]
MREFLILFFIAFATLSCHSNNSRAVSLSLSPVDEVQSAEYDLVTLSTTIHNPPGEIKSVKWQQLSGMTVSLSTADELSSTFISPSVEQDENLEFKFTAISVDGIETSLVTKVTIKAALVVPDEFNTIQDAIDSSISNELLLIRPGIYFENLSINDKNIQISSLYELNKDTKYIEETVIDGNGINVINIGANAHGTTLSGLTIQNGNDGVRPLSFIELYNNRFVGNTDAIDYESGSGGICHSNIFMDSIDDAIDIDGTVDIIISNNLIVDSQDDGIEIRFHPYSGPQVSIIIKNNIIQRSGEDGIQLIDYPETSNRTVRIERNLITDSTEVGIGFMADGNTLEDASGAPIPERINIVNNTLSNNSYGITGGANAVVINNILTGSTYTALRNLSENSIAAYNLFWNNATDIESSNTLRETNIFDSPDLDLEFKPSKNGAAIDAGANNFIWNNQVILHSPPSSILGPHLDIGYREVQ